MQTVANLNGCAASTEEYQGLIILPKYLGARIVKLVVIMFHMGVAHFSYTLSTPKPEAHLAPKAFTWKRL
jgi:hypothetical protein